ncbi:cell wall-binding repeat-containing protein [Diaminobutyricibacter sp. McL0618]|uniref:cell wall-binding repeat-containing protein n=1 Tax=Leifsonia sp. McL0618 TaxID=3415677 RepID=UPI003CE98428
MQKKTKRRSRAAVAATTFLLAGLVALPASAASAGAGDESGDWFGTDARMGRSSIPGAPQGTTRTRNVALDADAAVRAVVSPQSLALAQPGERLIVPKNGDLTLTLFGEERLAITVSEVAVTLDAEATENAPTVEVIGSKRVDGGDAATVAFTFIPDASGHYALHGGIERGTEPRVEIDQASPGVARLSELGDAAELPDEQLPADIHDAIAAPGAVTAPDPGANDNRGRAGAPLTTVDVLVGYASALGGTAKAAITQRITETNTALATSGVNIRLNLMAVTPVAYTQAPTGLSKDIENLRIGSEGLAVLHNQRDAIGADLVAMIVPRTNGACGWGYLPPDGLSVTAFDCLSGYSLAHEIGHNLGSDHDYANSSMLDRPYAFSYGHQVAGIARDIMAYPCANADCPRLLQYSNPNVNFIGHPTIPSGTATEDAARSFNLMAPVIADYRTKTQTSRLFGSDRYETAAAISRHGFTDPAQVSTVVVAAGTDFPDALSAAPLAAKLAGPLLLTNPSSLPAATTTEIKRLKPSKIVLIGGTGAVSTAVETTLKSLVTAGGTVPRISGADRYATSVAIGKYGWSSSTTAFIATGLDYPDALSAGAAAGNLGAPAVLVPGTSAAAPAATTAFLTSIGVTTAYIAGGTGSVSAGIEKDLKAKHTVVRYAGTDRFNTSTLIATAHHTKNGSMYLASAMNFPDALAGAAVAGRQKAPLVLSAPGCVLANLNDAQRVITPSQLVLLGGVTLLTEAVKDGTIC